MMFGAVDCVAGDVCSSSGVCVPPTRALTRVTTPLMQLFVLYYQLSQSLSLLLLEYQSWRYSPLVAQMVCVHTDM